MQTAYEVQGALRSKRWTVRSWAIAHGYHPRTVLHCIERFAPEKEISPKRKLAKKIMHDLSETLGVDLAGCKDE
ncbi:hypothetical protein BCT27_01410 [Enterovibrio norvegicus]|uniref:Uncharacterized protein n=1 Tax=Enterovibrio norvegicus TaxID=188144 RepID=A0A2N7L856_9GAMM|nr:hypothetical protein BCT27_01410 [Enterovibrio norvegicus]PMN90310.1 hypothetical protein BCT23_20290 [Enterovibrio norvegicus]